MHLTNNSKHMRIFTSKRRSSPIYYDIKVQKGSRCIAILSLTSMLDGIG
jgi:hypothetical protein